MEYRATNISLRSKFPLPVFISSLSRKELLEKLQQVDDINWSLTGVQSGDLGGVRPRSDRESSWASQKE